MTDTCRITAPGTGDQGAINTTTFQYDSAPGDVTIYEGICQFDHPPLPAAAQRVGGGEAAWDLQESILKLPANESDGVRSGQTVECLTSDDDPDLEGRKFGVVAVPTASQKTARRCRIREVVSV